MNLRHLLFRVKVRGESLWPQLVAGKCYWASNLLPIRRGDFVVFPNPHYQQEWYVKQVKQQYEDMYMVGGTVPWSSSFAIPTTSVIGKLFSNLPL